MSIVRMAPALNNNDLRARRSSSSEKQQQQCCDGIRRVKVFDSRRKQRWVDPLLTPPGSPNPNLPEPEPIIDDLLELWTGAGLDELADDHDISINSALNELGFTTDESLLASYSIPFPPGDAIIDDDEELLERLFEFVSDDSPPPTNPPSPPGELDLELDSAKSSCSGTTEKLYDEGFIGEEFINEQPDLFESAIRIAGPTSNIFTDHHDTVDMKIKHDCMWAGGLALKDNRFTDFTDDYDFKPFTTDIKVEKEDKELEDEEMAWEESYTWSETSSTASQTPPTTEDESALSPTSEAETETEDLLDWRDSSEELDFIRHAAECDHPYALPPPPPPVVKECIVKSESGAAYNFIKQIHGIMINGDDDWDPSQGPRKRRILVPLNDLVDSLKDSNFVVSPLGPGKNIIKLTGNETVQGVLGMHAGSNQLTFSTQSSHQQLASLIAPNHHHHSCDPNEADLVPNRRKQKSKTKDTTISILSEPSTPKPKKTKTHNNMERMRRIDLRNSFDALKSLVPQLAKANKCSKVEILRRSEEYINVLNSLEKRLLREEASVRSRNDALKVRLLQAQCA